MNPLAPPPSLLAKLGSIVDHFEESASNGGHNFDRIAAWALIDDREVVEWMDGMRKLALLPVTR